MIDRDTVVRLAKEAGLTNATIHSLSIFATLIANETLEMAAKACEDATVRITDIDRWDYPAEADRVQTSNTAKQVCANNIRALKDKP